MRLLQRTFQGSNVVFSKIFDKDKTWIYQRVLSRIKNGFFKNFFQGLKNYFSMIFAKDYFLGIIFGFLILFSRIKLGFFLRIFARIKRWVFKDLVKDFFKNQAWIFQRLWSRSTHGLFNEISRTKCRILINFFQGSNDGSMLDYPKKD